MFLNVRFLRILSDITPVDSINEILVLMTCSLSSVLCIRALAERRLLPSASHRHTSLILNSA